MISTYELACQLIDRGFSIIPIRGKRPARKWKEFQSRYATRAELKEWFLANQYSIAIVTGKISGVTVIDADNDAAVDAADALGLTSSIVQATKRGCHFLHPWKGERNTVRINGVPGLDRRGEGGYVAAYDGCADWEGFLR